MLFRPCHPPWGKHCFLPRKAVLSASENDAFLFDKKCPTFHNGEDGHSQKFSCRYAMRFGNGKIFYQMDTRSAAGMNIGSLSVMPKASYQAPIWGRAPFTRHSPSECTSIFVI